jgi:hypothetical protein
MGLYGLICVTPKLENLVPDWPGRPRPLQRKLSDFTILGRSTFQRVRLLSA